MAAPINHRPLDTNRPQVGNAIAIISGRGSLPVEIARGAISANCRPFMIGIEGEADSSIEEFDHRYMNLGQFGALLKLLKQENINQIVMAGGVHARPQIWKLKIDWGAITSIPRAMSLLWGGDDNLLSGLIKLFEDHNIGVLGAHQIAPHLLATSGVICGVKPSKRDMKNIELACLACQALGELDIGQAAIAEAARILAVEGVEGTDGMLQRIADLRVSGRIPQKGKNGVLVKMMKPGQDPRADLPAIGPNTIEKVKQAGLNGIALDAGRSMILQRAETLSLAKEHKIFIYGFQFNGKSESLGT